MSQVVSATGVAWSLPTPDERRAGQAIAGSLGLPELVGTVLALRGIGESEAGEFLNPRIDRSMPDPATLTDMSAAANRLARCVRDREPVAVYGDYDVDGACAVAMLVGWLRELGLAAAWKIPHRIRHGYGPQASLLEPLARNRKLVVIVDSGSSREAQPGIAAALDAGADVIVADHHACEERQRSDFLWVNPNRPEDPSGLGHLCAAGIVLMLMAATARALRSSGWFEAADRPEPRLKSWLDLVALATVADSVPLVGLNRALVRVGLRSMNEGRRPGIAALLERSRVRGTVTEEHLGWQLGPQLNAPGRIGDEEDDAGLAVRLLLADSRADAEQLAAECLAMNLIRRESQDRVLREVDAGRCRGGKGKRLAWFAPAAAEPGNPGWHPGVVGIAAGRLSERYRCPAVVFGSDSGRWKGSGRSWDGLDLGAAVRQAREEGLLIRGGGHRAAVGVEVRPDKAGEAMARIEALLEAAAANGPAERPGERLVGSVQPGGFTCELHDVIERAGPYGRAAPRPRVVLGGMRLHLSPHRIKDAHYRLLLSDEGGRKVKAMAFSAAGTPLGEALASLKRGDRVDVIGSIAKESWRGSEGVFMRMEDLALP